MPDPTLFEALLDALRAEERAGRLRFEADREGLGASERVAAGVAIAGLVVVDSGGFGLGRMTWTLELADGSEPGPILRSGDPVRIYRRRSPDDGVRGLVTRRTRRRLTIVLDDEPGDDLESAELVAEKQFDDKSHQRLVAAVKTMAGDPYRETSRWRELLLGERAPESGPVEAIEDAELNGAQRKAVSRALATKDAVIVHGPPGTGKTQVLGAIGRRAVARGDRLLAVAASNAAVDNLVARLRSEGLKPVRIGHPARVHDTLLDATLDAHIAHHSSAAAAAKLDREARDLSRRADRAARQGRASDRFAEAREGRAQARRLWKQARELMQQAKADVIDGAQVICATLTGLGGSVLRGQRFDLALVDEATQATAPAAFMALLCSTRVVLAGDHHQLPPTVLSPDADRLGLGSSLYDRWLEAHGDEAATMLEVQHRMHQEIMRFPSLQLYDDRLQAHPLVARHLLDELDGVVATDVTSNPLLVIDTAGKGWNEASPAVSESRSNAGEAARVVREVEALLQAGLPPQDIGVIAPYAAQVQLLRALLPQERIEIDTVDAFQGREKEAIAVSLTRSNDHGDIGFCADVRRMNVALTRARRRLLVVGDSATLGQHPFYAAFFDSAQARGAYRSAWEELDV